MLKPATPSNEAARLETLRSLSVLDTRPEERFDRVTRLARRLFDVPIAVVSLVDAERQWFKSCQGLRASETPREISFCGHAILDQALFVVADAKTDQRFIDNPLVVDEPHVRFYAGAPLSVNGYRLGTLCLIDRRPRSLTDDDRALLRDLADMVEQELATLEMASVDALTGLSNRRAFEELARHALALALRSRKTVTLLFLDMDGFKQINDTAGHEQGDRALVEMANLLKDVFRESDVVARLGGDEFCVLLVGASEADARRPLAALDATLAEANAAEGRRYLLRYSAGAVCFDPARHRSVACLMREADERMYASKRERRGDAGR